MKSSEELNTIKIVVVVFLTIGHIVALIVLGLMVNECINPEPWYSDSLKMHAYVSTTIIFLLYALLCFNTSFLINRLKGITL